MRAEVVATTVQLWHHGLSQYTWNLSTACILAPASLHEKSRLECATSTIVMHFSSAPLPPSTRSACNRVTTDCHTGFLARQQLRFCNKPQQSHAPHRQKPTPTAHYTFLQHMLTTNRPLLRGLTEHHTVLLRSTKKKTFARARQRHVPHTAAALPRTPRSRWQQASGSHAAAITHAAPVLARWTHPVCPTQLSSYQPTAADERAFRATATAPQPWQGDKWAPASGASEPSSPRDHHERVRTLGTQTRTRLMHVRPLKHHRKRRTDIICQILQPVACTASPAESCGRTWHPRA